MSHLSVAVSVLTVAALVAGCGGSAVIHRPTGSTVVGGAAPAQTGTVAHSFSAMVSALAGSGVPATTGVPVRVPPTTQSAPHRAAEPVPTAAVGGGPANPIVAIGDSLTFGWGRGASPIPYGPAPAHSYPWYLEHDLGIPVVNAGVSGTTAREVLDPSSEPGHPRPQSLQLPALLALHPRLLIVSFGSNEAVRGWPVGQTAADLDRILSRVTAAGVPVVLVGTHVDCAYLPCQDPAPGYSRQRYLSNWDGMLIRLAARYGAGLVLDVEHGFGDSELTDWLHPNARGYALMALRIEPAVRAIFYREGNRPAAPAATMRPAPELSNGGGAPGEPARQPEHQPPPPDPQPQGALWPGGPRNSHNLLPLNLEKLLSLLG
jgi:acyl-CoA thioesterase I